MITTHGPLKSARITRKAIGVCVCGYKENGRNRLVEPFKLILAKRQTKNDILKRMSSVAYKIDLQPISLQWKLYNLSIFVSFVVV